MLDGDRRGEGAQHAVQGGAPRAADFLTPRSSMTTTVQPQNNWMNALEVPRWVSRLGNYLATGRGELAPSPLAGSVMSSPSPPGGQAFRLRSPIRAGRPMPPPTPPSSEISAEAIQAEVQRQLGGLLNRLQVAENRNDALMSESETPPPRGTAGAPAAEVIKPGTTSLPTLPEMVQGAETAMKFQDWLELTTAVMCDVSEQSGIWWRQVLEEVERAYKMWLSCTPLERLAVQPKGEELSANRWVRLNARVENMLATRPATSTATTPTAADGPKLRALTQGDRDKDKSKGKDKEKGERPAEQCRYFMKPTGWKTGTDNLYIDTDLSQGATRPAG
ncbi:unnamed protein product [Symbiodinium necroappetens]|uniref:Uncharacterized protein n=1 Tax=Symbiodinium necroappetens TaxID=1628268 RepID=A0A812MLH6_9DINO|nr:unnamed protein product [Symbiodinium necroappetens]